MMSYDSQMNDDYDDLNTTTTTPTYFDGCNGAFLNGDLDQLFASIENECADLVDTNENVTATLLSKSQYDQILSPLTPLQVLIAKLIARHGVRFIEPLSAELNKTTDLEIRRLALTNPKLYYILTTRLNQLPKDIIIPSEFKSTKPTILPKLRLQSQTETVTSSRTASVTWQSMNELYPGQWLSMDIINTFFEMVELYAIQQNEIAKTTLLAQSPAGTTEAQLPHIFQLIYPLNSGFFPMFSKGDNFQYNYSLVARWSGRRKTLLNNCRYVAVPCHINGNHWTFVFADIYHRVIVYLDSFHQPSDDGRAEILAKYLEDEYNKYGGYNGYDEDMPNGVWDKSLDLNPFWPYKSNRPQNDENQNNNNINNTNTNNTTTKTAEKPKRYAPFKIVHPTNIPKQTNTCDCGVFVCMFMYCLLLNVPFGSFSVKFYQDLLDKEQKQQELLQVQNNQHQNVLNSNNNNNNNSNPGNDNDDVDNDNNTNNNTSSMWTFFMGWAQSFASSWFGTQSDMGDEDQSIDDDNHNNNNNNNNDNINNNKPQSNTAAYVKLCAEARTRLKALPIVDGMVQPFTQQDLNYFRHFILLSIIERRLFNLPRLNTKANEELLD